MGFIRETFSVTEFLPNGVKRTMKRGTTRIEGPSLSTVVTVSACLTVVCVASVMFPALGVAVAGAAKTAAVKTAATKFIASNAVKAIALAA